MPTNPNLHAHREKVAVAEAARQQSLKTAVTEADRKLAHKTYHLAVLASSRVNGVKCNSIAALAALGYDPGDWRDGDVQMSVTNPEPIRLEVSYIKLMAQSPAAVDAARERWVASGGHPGDFTDQLAWFLNRGGHIEQFDFVSRRGRRRPAHTTNGGNPPR